MRRTDEQIEKRLAARGVDVQSDEGARLLQSEIEREQMRQSKPFGALLIKPSDLKPRLKVRGITI
jgi:hypothetical protein